MWANQVCMLTRAQTGWAKTAGARVVVLREWSCCAVVGGRGHSKEQMAGDEDRRRGRLAGLQAACAWAALQGRSKAISSASPLAARQTQCETLQHHHHLSVMRVVSWPRELSSMLAVLVESTVLI